MASIETIVKVTITKGSQQIPLVGFGVAVIFGPSNRIGSDPIRYYTNPSDMLTDGFLLADPEYIHAAELMEQTPSPVKFGVSKFTAAVAQVDTFAVSTLVATGHAYNFTLNGTLITYTSSSDTQQSILTALLAAIGTAFPTNPPVTGAVTGTGVSALLTLTASVAGVGVSYTAIDADLTHVALTPSHSIAQDIATLQVVDDTWYGALVTSKITSDIEQVAAYIETQKKVYATASSDAGILTSSITDLASFLKGKNYERTNLIYSAAPSAAPDAAWMGRMFPTIPGAGNWKFKTLKGVTADNLSATSIGNAQGKNANIYVPFGGVPLTAEGVASSGEFFDVTILIDWIQATMEANVFSVLANNDKIPYTNKGIAAIENPVRQTLQAAQDNGGLAAGWTVSSPDVSTVSNADKASRTLNNVKFTATLAGAINKVNIQGLVSV